MIEHKKVEFIESYIRVGNDYQWNDNHGDLVRCKDCKHRVCNGNDRNSFFCEYDTGDPYALGRNAHLDDWFCADGERKE